MTIEEAGEAEARETGLQVTAQVVTVKTRVIRRYAEEGGWLKACLL